MKYVNNTGLELEVISRNGKQCIIKFLGSGSTRKANIDNIRVGKVKDLYNPSRYGVGYDGEFIKTPYWKKAKDLWSNMLKRCYYEGDSKGYFGRCTVDKRWHCFSNFLEDIKELKGFRQWLSGVDRMELDKDIKHPGNTVYSRHTCLFVTYIENRQAQPNYRIGKEFCKETQSWITTKA